MNDLFVIFISLCAVAFVSFLMGRLYQFEEDAEQATSETPAKLWTDALIDARARQEKRG